MNMDMVDTSGDHEQNVNLVLHTVLPMSKWLAPFLLDWTLTTFAGSMPVLIPST